MTNSEKKLKGNEYVLNEVAVGPNNMRSTGAKDVIDAAPEDAAGDEISMDLFFKTEDLTLLAIERMAVTEEVDRPVRRKRSRTPFRSRRKFRGA
jgi:hypothetical protein